MRKALTTLLLLLISTTLLGQQTAWFTGTFEEATELAGKEEKLLLINFSSNT